MLVPLLWKDIRLNRFVILLAIFLVDTPYLTTAFALSAFTGDSEINTSLTERLSIAFPFSLLFLALASAFIGGTPIAAERAERTDRFLAYLPPTRLAVVTSKVMIAISVLLLAWIVPLVVFFACDRPKNILFTGLSASLVLFGLAWLVSLYVRSSTVSGLASLIGGVIVLIAVRKLCFAYYGTQASSHMVDVMLWASIGFVVVTFATGIGLFLRLPAD
jgi:ABC-type transport system involved in multi-copper enzyme maturation permease subunit